MMLWIEFKLLLLLFIFLDNALTYIQFNILKHRFKRHIILDAYRRVPIAKKMEKIHHINSIFPIRKYEAEDHCQRMIKNSMKDFYRTALDAEYSKEYNWPYRKRHKGGRKDTLVFERKVVAVAKWLQLSPIKANKILRQIKKMPVLVALGDLAQRGSNPYALAVYKVIKSALFNAKVLYGNDPNIPLMPKFKELSATVGGFIKRPLFRAKGRCDIIRKPKAHIRVVLSV